MLKVGFGTSALGVPDGTLMGGYAFRTGVSAGILDPLRITALTWYDGARRAALVLADTICVNSDLTRAVRAALPDVDLVWLAASHTHAGPETGCVPGGGPTPAGWLEHLTAGAVAAVNRARVTEAGSHGRFHTGTVDGVGAVRSDTAGEPLVPVDLIEVSSAGRRSGLIVVLPVHPTVLPAANLMVSADLTGAVRRALSAQVGPGVWVAVATGAAGDISTRHTRQGQDTAELDRLGRRVAEHCLELLGKPATAGWSTGSQLSWRGRAVELRPKPRPDDDVLVDAASAALADARSAGDPAAVRVAEGNLDGARLTAIVEPPDRIEAEVGVLRIGRLTLTALPGEPFLATAEELRRDRTDPMVVLGYANSYPGYLPPMAAYDGSGYEVLAAAVAPGAAEWVARAAADLATELDG